MKKIFSFLAVLGMLLGLGVVLKSSQATVSAAPFSCDGSFYMTRDPGDGTGVQLYRMNRQENVSVAFNQMVGTSGLTIGGQPYVTADPGAGLNALGYNPVDRYFYAVRVSSGGTNTPTVFRIHSDGALEAVGLLDVSNVGDDEVWGATFDQSGNMYVKGHYADMEVIHGLDAAPTTPFTQTHVNVSVDIHMGDLVWDFSSNSLYAYGNDLLYRINTTTGVATVVTQSGINPASINTIGVGSLFMDATNNLYAYGNDSAGFYAVNKTNGKFTLLETGAIASNTDGASCVPVGLSIDAVKTAGTVTATNATTFVIPYTVVIGNKGIVSDPNVQAVDNLKVTFADGTPTIAVAGTTVSSGSCTVNASFDGTTNIKLLSGTDTLAAGASCTVKFNVTLTYATSDDVPTDEQLNTVYASTASSANGGHYYTTDGTIYPPANLLAEDDSTDDPALPSSANGDTPEPTPVTLGVSTVVDPVVTPAPTVPDTGLAFVKANPALSLIIALFASAGIVFAARRLNDLQAKNRSK